MKHIRNLCEVRLPASSLTIGSFDGVHLGHQALLKAMVEHARQAGVPSVVLTFFPHPSVVLRGRKPAFYINTPEEKAQRVSEFGVDIMITLRFDRALSEVGPEDFLTRLHDHLHFQDLWIGQDFAMGHNREGNRHFLEARSAAHGYRLHVIPRVLIEGEIVSSTRVREALRSGDVARVERYLGKPFMLPGRVVRGVGRGRSLGFPTANLAIWDERAHPRSGVYACLAEVKGAQWQAVTNIGVRPTFGEGKPAPIVETHLLDFEGDLYDEIVRLSFFARLRDEQKFPDAQALMERITRDIARAREILDHRLEESHHA